MESEKAFHYLKKKIENSVVESVDESLLFELECDASGIAIALLIKLAD